MRVSPLRSLPLNRIFKKMENGDGEGGRGGGGREETMRGEAGRREGEGRGGEGTEERKEMDPKRENGRDENV